MLLSKIDEFGKAGWVAIVVLGFWLAWPIGLMTLAFLAGSGRLRMCGGGRSRGKWFNMDNSGTSAGGMPFGGVWGRKQPQSSGNKAFDDYREETLRRLEEEEREFQSFLERLRRARDKSEFDSFIAERRGVSDPAQSV
jgi:hypothetical protein